MFLGSSVTVCVCGGVYMHVCGCMDVRYMHAHECGSWRLMSRNVVLSPFPPHSLSQGLSAKPKAYRCG